MAELKSGTTIGGAVPWTKATLNLIPNGDSINYKGFKIYTENDKPTNAETDTVSASKGGGYGGRVTFNAGLVVKGSNIGYNIDAGTSPNDINIKTTRVNFQTHTGNTTGYHDFSIGKFSVNSIDAGIVEIKSKQDSKLRLIDDKDSIGGNYLEFFDKSDRKAIIGFAVSDANTFVIRNDRGNGTIQINDKIHFNGIQLMDYNNITQSFQQRTDLVPSVKIVQDGLENRVLKGGTETIVVKNVDVGLQIESRSDFPTVRLQKSDGRKVDIQPASHSNPNFLTFVYREANNTNISVIRLPSRSTGTIALEEETWSRTHQSRVRNYCINGTANIAWVNFARLELGQNGRMVSFRFVLGAGFNGNIEQGLYANVIFRTGNDSVAVGHSNRAFIKAYVSRDSGFDVEAVEVSKDVWELWARIPPYANNSYYTIESQSYASDVDGTWWTPKQNHGTVPSTGRCNKAVYVMYSGEHKPTPSELGVYSKTESDSKISFYNNNSETILKSPNWNPSARTGSYAYLTTSSNFGIYNLATNKSVFTVDPNGLTVISSRAIIKAPAGQSMSAQFISDSDYSSIQIVKKDGRYVSVESNPHGQHILNFNYRESSGNNITVVSVPAKSGTLAISSDHYTKGETYTRAEVDSKITSQSTKGGYVKIPLLAVEDGGAGRWLNTNKHTIQVASVPYPTIIKIVGFNKSGNKQFDAPSDTYTGEPVFNLQCLVETTIGTIDYNNSLPVLFSDLSFGNRFLKRSQTEVILKIPANTSGSFTVCGRSQFEEVRYDKIKRIEFYGYAIRLPDNGIIS